MEELKKLIEEFLDFLLKKKAAARHTVEAYKSDLEQFGEFLRIQPQRITTIKGINPKLILNYLSYLKSKNYSASTLNRKFAALRSFFDYLIVQGEIKINPTENTAYPATRTESRRQALPAQEIEKLLALLQESSKPEVRRDLTILELLYKTGIRITELTALDVDMVKLDLRNPRIVIREEERVILIPPRLAQTLKGYVEQIRPRLVSAKRERALFLGRGGGRLTRQGLWNNLRKYAKAAGVKYKITPNILRHSFAVHQLASGVSLEELQKQLGHARIEITSKYLRML